MADTSPDPVPEPRNAAPGGAESRSAEPRDPESRASGPNTAEPPAPGPRAPGTDSHTPDTSTGTDTDTGGSGVPELGEINLTDWYAHADKLVGVGFLTVARRLPALVAQAVRLAWLASPRDTATTIALSLLSGVFTAFGLLATTGVLTALFEAGPTPERVRAALPSLVLVGVAATLRTLTQAGAGWAQSRLDPQVSRIAEERLYGLTSRVGLAAFDDPDFHDALQRARARGVSMADVVVGTAIDVLTAAIGIVAAAGVLGVLHPVLLPLLVLAVLPDAWAAVRAARMRYTTMYRLIPAARRKWITAQLLADGEPAAEVRSFTMRGFLMRMYDAVSRAEQAVLLDLARRQTFTRVLGEGLSGVGTALVYVALGLLLAAGAVPLAVAGTAVLAIRSGQTYLANLMYATNRLYEEGLYFTDFLEFCADAEARLTSGRSGPVPEGFERITAEDVVFTYPGSDSPALQGVSVHLDRGEVVALVGENGSGKTTLAKILSGLYEPDGGRVRWDGTDLSEVDPDRLRRHIAVIAQDHTRWPLTARQNITMGTDKGEPALVAAAEVAGADQVMADLPHGYDTLLDRRFKDGQELSGGQWQRIAVARGFHRDAPLLICDEPTAALDARAEHALFERVREHAGGRTVLLITHRLASVRYADRIYVLDHGKVTEEGTHTELMELGGLYAELYGLQARAYSP
ncbi:multidrug ABC transporter permease [Planomonospora parontospora subsp. parontospora]|uniref:Multidrug ABC transporter permease n=1 Tax=Planomonospora parontospora subsp. parontospora TaxID=97194 RepID=A0ABQ4H4A7_9ACTN|nr:ABC transporter ATP-binding protein [Planomonospora parontospora]GII06971.1 multidrug ABC transporter permease [Planomonospora parontospora subsp. parontospora]